MKNILIVSFLICLSSSIFSQDTFSIVAVDSVTGEVGSAGASCVDMSYFPGYDDDFLGELFPGIGAINTQAWYNATNQANARSRMNLGDTPNEIIAWLIDNDVNNQPQLRQYGIVAMVNGSPESAGYTGTSTDDYKNHIAGPNYCIQGNILLGQEVLDGMEQNFLNTEGDLACKLMAALQGANMVGADSRCASNGTSSLFAFLKVAQPDDVFGNPSFLVSVRTPEDAGIEPIDSLQILFDEEHNCIISGLNSKVSLESQFVIHPNPVDAFIVVEDLSNSTESFNLEILDITGSQIYKNIFKQDIEINSANFSKGLYFIRISNDKQSFTSKIIKK
jgi:uncharacterized Ntn-hydrolase superfamily protein